MSLQKLAQRFFVKYVVGGSTPVDWSLSEKEWNALSPENQQLWIDSEDDIDFRKVLENRAKNNAQEKNKQFLSQNKETLKEVENHVKNISSLLNQSIERMGESRALVSLQKDSKDVKHVIVGVKQFESLIQEINETADIENKLDGSAFTDIYTEFNQFFEWYVNEAAKSIENEYFQKMDQVKNQYHESKVKDIELNSLYSATSALSFLFYRVAQSMKSLAISPEPVAAHHFKPTVSRPTRNQVDGSPMDVYGYFLATTKQEFLVNWAIIQNRSSNAIRLAANRIVHAVRMGKIPQYHYVEAVQDALKEELKAHHNIDLRTQKQNLDSLNQEESTSSDPDDLFTKDILNNIGTK